MKKIVLTQKQMISDSKPSVEHPLAGQNTPQFPMVSVLDCSYQSLKLGLAREQLSHIQRSTFSSEIVEVMHKLKETVRFSDGN